MTTLSNILAGIVLLTASFSTALAQEVKAAPKQKLEAKANTLIKLKVDAPVEAKAKAFRLELNAQPQVDQVKAKAEVLIERNGERIRW